MLMLMLLCSCCCQVQAVNVGGLLCSCMIPTIIDRSRYLDFNALPIPSDLDQHYIRISVFLHRTCSETCSHFFFGAGS